MLESIGYEVLLRPALKLIIVQIDTFKFLGRRENSDVSSHVVVRQVDVAERFQIIHIGRDLACDTVVLELNCFEALHVDPAT